MKFSNVTTTFEQLSKEQQELVLNKQIKGHHTIDEWLQFFREAAVYDRYQYEKWEGVKWMTNTKVIAISFLIFMVMAMILQEDLMAIAFVFGLIAAINIAIYAYGAYKEKKWKKTDLSNHLRLFIVPTLVMLKEEVKKNQLVYLDVSLHDTHQDQFFKRKIRDDALYEQVWLKAKTKLIDGTRLHWEARDLFRYRRYYKKSRSGKNKLKIKQKVKFYLNLSVAIPKNQYRLSSSTRNQQLMEDKDYYLFKAKGKNTSDTLSRSMEVNLFLSLILGAYRQVTPLK